MPKIIVNYRYCNRTLIVKVIQCRKCSHMFLGGHSVFIMLWSSYWMCRLSGSGSGQFSDKYRVTTNIGTKKSPYFRNRRKAAQEKWHVMAPSSEYYWRRRMLQARYIERA